MLGANLRLTVDVIFEHGRIHHYVPTVWHETLTLVRTIFPFRNIPDAHASGAQGRSL